MQGRRIYPMRLIHSEAFYRLVAFKAFVLDGGGGLGGFGLGRTIIQTLEYVCMSSKQGLWNIIEPNLALVYHQLWSHFLHLTCNLRFCCPQFVSAAAYYLLEVMVVSDPMMITPLFVSTIKLSGLMSQS